jgi:hypothetical protein
MDTAREHTDSEGPSPMQYRLVWTCTAPTPAGGVEHIMGHVRVETPAAVDEYSPTIDDECLHCRAAGSDPHTGEVTRIECLRDDRVITVVRVDDTATTLSELLYRSAV